MSVYKQKGSKNWWYKFTWRGCLIRESAKQPKKGVAEQIEAAHKVLLARSRISLSIATFQQRAATSIRR